MEPFPVPSYELELVVPPNDPDQLVSDVIVRW